MWDFLFGPDRIDDLEFVRIGARSYDIDVVEGVASLMKQDLDAQDAAMVAKRANDPDVPNMAQDELPSSRLPVRVEVIPKPLPGAAITDPREIPLAEVPGLSRSERSRLRVSGAQARVDFMRAGHPNVWSSRPALRDSLEQYLRTEGRRRINWTRLAAALPAAAGAVLLPLWVLASLQQHFEAATVTFGLLLAAGAFAVGIYASKQLATTSVNTPRGSRFREVSREDFRSAITNVRAGVLTTAGGTLLGVVLTVLFYKLTGIEPA
ncbi:hypothetical protein ACIPC2_14250 [Curtobacterium pusillum]|uniref:hypothetical protein n=1 Tax=Curtobacterium pusillum TaxID=69373 RepID=UPI00380D632B